MRLLLDTHIFLWFLVGDKKLAVSLREAISDPQNEIFLSVVSLWEIIIKHHLGHLPLPEPPELYVPTQRRRFRIASLSVDEGSVFQVAKLPPLHRDPFDRLLIGQAIEHNLKLVTVDAAICAYPTAPVFNYFREPYYVMFDLNDLIGVQSSSVYSLQFVTFYLEHIIGLPGRVRVKILDTEMNVEEAVTKIFQERGFDVARGEDINFLSFGLVNKSLHKSDFASESCRYTAYHSSLSEEYMTNLVKSASALFKKYRANGYADIKPLLRNLEARCDAWYGCNTPTSLPSFESPTVRLFSAFLEQFPDLAEHWVKWFETKSHDPRGVPDLFLWNRQSGEWFWAEVKSEGDSIRQEQWIWLEHFQAQVSPNVYVIRILPTQYPKPSEKLAKFIIMSPTLHNGVPCLRCGLKVSYVINQIALGKTDELLRKNYGLTEADIDAAWDYMNENSSREYNPVRVN